MGKGGRCVGLTTLPPSCADCLEIWEPQPAGTLRTSQACNGIALHISIDRRPRYISHKLRSTNWGSVSGFVCVSNKVVLLSHLKFYVLAETSVLRKRRIISKNSTRKNSMNCGYHKEMPPQMTEQLNYYSQTMFF